MARRFIALFIVLTALLTLCGCGGAQTAQDAAQTTAATVSASAGNVVFNVSESMAVIRGDTSADTVTQAAVKLRRALEEHFGVDKVKIDTDWKKNPTYDYELIVGDTTRPALYGDDVDVHTCGEKGFLVRAVGNHVYIVGGSDDATAAAVDWFITKFIDGVSGDVLVPENYEYVQAQQYDVPKLFIAGADSAAYPVIVGSAGKKASEALQQELYARTGIWHEIVSADTAATPGFIIETDDLGLAPGMMYVRVSDGSLCFYAASYAALESCVSSFDAEYLDSASGSVNFPDGFEYSDIGDTIIVNY